MTNMLPRGENMLNMPSRGENVPKWFFRGENMSNILSIWDNVPNMLSRGENMPNMFYRGGEYARYVLGFLQGEIMPNKLRGEKILSDYEGRYAKICQEAEPSKKESMPNF